MHCRYYLSDVKPRNENDGAAEKGDDDGEVDLDYHEEKGQSAGGTCCSLGALIGGFCI